MSAERVSLNRKEFEAFLAENKELTDRVEKLVEQQRRLEEELKAAKEREEAARLDRSVDTRQTERAIRNARQTIARLMEETDKKASH
ncbi:MAG: hypothetical protein ABSD99_02155 [Candidatus Bathyarchaeia archaeon]|jgi:predicted  nucleic acid-binding Zn-ribbon protein